MSTNPQSPSPGSRSGGAAECSQSHPHPVAEGRQSPGPRDLLPCPYCGERPGETILMGDRIATCETATCGNKGQPYLDADWNRRAPAPVPAGLYPADIEAVDTAIDGWRRHLGGGNLFSVGAWERIKAALAAPGAPQEEGPAGVDLADYMRGMKSRERYLKREEARRAQAPASSPRDPGAEPPAAPALAMNCMTDNLEAAAIAVRNGRRGQAVEYIESAQSWLRDLRRAWPSHPPEDTPIEAAGDLEAAVDAFGDAVEALTKAEYRSGSDREIRPYKEAYYEARAKILEWGHLATRPGTAIEKAAREALRPEVLAFAHLMEQKLRENDHKGGWGDCSPDWLLARVRQETEEIAQLMLLWGDTSKSRVARTEIAQPIGREAADVANFAMMIADVCGALSGLPQEGAAGEGGAG